MATMASGTRWTRDELLVALNIYHKLSFGQLHARQPVVVDIARYLGRTSGSVAMKLCNFASLDATLHLRGIKGLAGASALDRSVWHEFHENLSEMVPASEEALQKRVRASEDAEVVGPAVTGAAPSLPEAVSPTMASACMRSAAAASASSALFF